MKTYFESSYYLNSIFKFDQLDRIALRLNYVAIHHRVMIGILGGIPCVGFGIRASHTSDRVVNQ